MSGCPLRAGESRSPFTNPQRSFPRPPLPRLSVSMSTNRAIRMVSFLTVDGRVYNIRIRPERPVTVARSRWDQADRPSPAPTSPREGQPLCQT